MTLQQYSMRKPDEKERLVYLKKVWARANEVFRDRKIAEAMVHAFAWFEMGEESVADLTIIEYESLLSWLRWCQARIDMIGEIHFKCFDSAEVSSSELA
jgi:hypothetical protein